MAYVAVNINGEECIYLNKPKLNSYGEYVDLVNCGDKECYCTSIPLPKGTIEKLIDKELTWNNEPVELK